MHQDFDPRPAALAWAIINFELGKAKDMVAGGVNLFDDPSINITSIFHDVAGNMHHAPAECLGIVEFLVEQGYGQALYDDPDTVLPSSVQFSDDPVKYYLYEAGRQKSNWVPEKPFWEAPSEYLTPHAPEDARPAAMAWAIINFELGKAKDMAEEGINLHNDPSISIARIFVEIHTAYKHSGEERSAVIEFLLDQGYGQDLYENSEFSSNIAIHGWDDPVDYIRYSAATGKFRHPDLPDNHPPAEKPAFWKRLMPKL